MSYDVVIRGGSVYDGTGTDPVATDVAIAGEEIARVGALDEGDIAEAGLVVDASGLAVAPGFINVLSHSYVSMIKDPRLMGELVQGVTTQLFGEGFSMGPVNDRTRKLLADELGNEIPWTTLREYLHYMEKRGVAQNVASLVGATTLRIEGAGFDDRPMTDQELDRVKSVLADEMADGAFGLGSALIYPPGFYASTEELVELAKVAGRYGGTYFSHLRSEGDDWEKGVDELLRISREGEVAAEVWHIKAAGRQNWPKMDPVLDTLEAARDAGEISADMYPYTAGGTSLTAAVPPRYAVGGTDALRARLDDASTRAEIASAIADEVGAGWENLYLGSGGGDGVFMVAVRAADRADEAAVTEAKTIAGRTLADYASSLGTDPVDAALALIRRFDIGCMYFIIDEANIRKAVARPWISVGSDAASQAVPEGPDGEGTHPRSYGAFARFLGHYCRDEGLAPLAQGIHRMSGLPAGRLGIERRGELRAGWFADVVVFDPSTYADTATYEQPHSYALGMRHVFVNGAHTLKDGEHTGAFAGRALAGRGRR
jgi:N-acyl-D-aspartate/D-glutamate deacylase